MRFNASKRWSSLLDEAWAPANDAALPRGDRHYAARNRRLPGEHPITKTLNESPAFLPLGYSVAWAEVETITTTSSA